ncbi:MAG: hypothetical protein RBT64_08095 [Trichloromonas sp.]|jgi:hypothetical protein|nr:hypothetical protein [Trichloromonas sp.]
MHPYEDVIGSRPAFLPRRSFRRMAQLVQCLYRLSRDPAYRAEILPKVPEIARFDPGHDALMMGYDFHQTAAGPRLIEVNTNAGGWLPALLACHGEAVLNPGKLPPRAGARLLGPFREEFLAWNGGRPRLPTGLAIIDEEPNAQFLYGEMAYCRELLEETWKIPVALVDAAELAADDEGVRHAGKQIELIYNRHCDFYLEAPALAGLRAAYRAGKVCLSPNPFAYGLLADKRRLALWSDGEALAELGLAAADRRLLTELVPTSRLLGDLDRENLWREKKDWVFKPVARFGSQGVLLGAKITRGRFGLLDPKETLVQRHVSPSRTEKDGHPEMKTDFRLYAYRDRVLGVTARLYRGQVTSLRTPGGGFAPVILT